MINSRYPGMATLPLDRFTVCYVDKITMIGNDGLDPLIKSVTEEPARFPVSLD